MKVTCKDCKHVYMAVNDIPLSTTKCPNCKKQLSEYEGRHFVFKHHSVNLKDLTPLPVCACGAFLNEMGKCLRNCIG